VCRVNAPVAVDGSHCVVCADIAHALVRDETGMLMRARVSHLRHAQNTLKEIALCGPADVDNESVMQVRLLDILAQVQPWWRVACDGA
jgi:hypothetical protein